MKRKILSFILTLKKKVDFKIKPIAKYFLKLLIPSAGLICVLIILKQLLPISISYSSIKIIL